MSEEKTYWALDLSIDLYGCAVDKFNANDITLFANTLGEYIDKDKGGTTEISEFGKGEELMEGLRLVHHTYACLVTAHFVKSSERAYINIHSCEPYKPSEVIELCGDFFETAQYGCKKQMRD